MNVLFIDACVRENSRTRELAEYVIAQLKDDSVSEVKVEHIMCGNVELPEMNESFINFRNRASASGNFDSPVFDHARRFASADAVVIAAPFWDLSFPAILKRYLEHLCVPGVTFKYDAHGIPVSLCNAKRLIYVTTAGGPIFDDAFGFGYVKALAEGYFGIDDVRMLKAENLDIDGADVEAILDEAKAGFML